MLFFKPSSVYDPGCGFSKLSCRAQIDLICHNLKILKKYHLEVFFKAKSYFYQSSRLYLNLLNQLYYIKETQT